MRAQPPASHFINGSYQEDPHGRPIENRYPATGEVIARLCSAGSETVNAAVAAARSGFRVWAATPAAERGRVLRRAAEVVDAARLMNGRGIAGPAPKVEWPALMAFKRSFTDPVPNAREKAFADKGIATFNGGNAAQIGGIK